MFSTDSKTSRQTCQKNVCKFAQSGYGDHTVTPAYKKVTVGFGN